MFVAIIIRLADLWQQVGGQEWGGGVLTLLKMVAVLGPGHTVGRSCHCSPGLEDLARLLCTILTGLSLQSAPSQSNRPVVSTAGIQKAVSREGGLKGHLSRDPLEKERSGA